MRVTRGSRRAVLSVFHHDKLPGLTSAAESSPGAPGSDAAGRRLSGLPGQCLRRPPVWASGTAGSPQNVFLFHRSGDDFSLHEQRKAGAGSPRCSAHPGVQQGAPRTRVPVISRAESGAQLCSSSSFCFSSPSMRPSSASASRRLAAPSFWMFSTCYNSRTFYFNCTFF